MPAANLERVIDITKGDLVAIILGLHSGQPRQTDQRISMYTIKAVSKLGFERLEWIFDENFTLLVAHSDVLLLGVEIVNFLYRHQHQAAAHTRTDMLAWFELG